MGAELNGSETAVSRETMSPESQLALFLKETGKLCDTEKSF
jgi:hypothetical protein